MKRFRFGMGIGLAMLGLCALVRAESFEGRVKMSVSGGKDAHPIEYAIKGDRMRMEMAESGKKGPGGVIIDFKAREMIILMDHDGQKMFMKRPMPSEQEVKKMAGDHEVSEPKPTGKTETIAGYSADEYIVESKDKTVTHLWLGKGLGTFFSPSSMGGGPFGGKPKSAEAWEQVARKSGLFPLRVVTLDTAGKERSRMEVTQIDKGALPESLFSTDGYTEFKIPGFGGGF